MNRRNIDYFETNNNSIIPESNIVDNKPNMYPGSKVHGAKMGPTWVLSAPDGPHVGPMNLAIWVYLINDYITTWKHFRITGHLCGDLRHSDVNTMFVNYPYQLIASNTTTCPCVNVWHKFCITIYIDTNPCMIHIPS